MLAMCCRFCSKTYVLALQAYLGRYLPHGTTLRAITHVLRSERWQLPCRTSRSLHHHHRPSNPATFPCSYDPLRLSASPWATTQHAFSFDIRCSGHERVFSRPFEFRSTPANWKQGAVKRNPFGFLQSPTRYQHWDQFLPDTSVLTLRISLSVNLLRASAWACVLGIDAKYLNSFDLREEGDILSPVGP